jgi:two-component system chemotaxis sensor kinase CheA
MAQDPYRYFRPEAQELINAFAKSVLDLEKGESAAGAVHKLLRLAHTLKGAARIVKQTEIAKLAHAIEDTLEPLRDAQSSSVDRAAINSVLGCLDRIAALLADIDKAPKEESAKPAGESVDAVRFVRTEISEVEAVLDGVHEARALLNGGGTRDQLDRELAQLREAAEQLRLSPVDILFTALERTARDTAAACGKRVTFAGTGSEIRLDSAVIETLQAAFVQLVRNAVAHGVEVPADRLALNKPEAGRVAVEVSRRGRRIAFAVSDDGCGIDLDAVRRAAEQRGLLAAAGAAPDTDALMRILLNGGISTAADVTDVSGRGIGLDVVREAAERLGGQISCDTKPNTGTRFELLIPPSLAALDTLFVDAERATYALPLDTVRRTLRVPASEICDGPNGATLVFEEAIVPFAPLARLLTGTAVADRGHWTVVIVGGTDGLAALGVTRLRGAAKSVVRPLPLGIKTSAAIAGTTLDVEGNPQLILDPDGLVAAVSARYDVARSAAPAKRPLLVVDDSMTTRMLEKSILESAGYEVDVATSGEEGFDRVRAKAPALILVDVEMPGMDGFTFIERLRADRALREIPAILVTSRVSPDDIRRGRDAGANGHIAKSEFDQARLLSMIEGLTGA